MSEPEEFADYSSYLDQPKDWPSAGTPTGDTVPIEEMSPQHAVSCYQKVLRWAARTGRGKAFYTDSDLRHTSLMLSLAYQALGLDYESAIEPSARELSSDEALEALMDISEANTSQSAAGHLRTARQLLEQLDLRGIVLLAQDPASRGPR